MKNKNVNYSGYTNAKLETRVYDFDFDSNEQFILECKKAGYEYIIWVADAQMNNKTLWAITKETLLSDFLTFSDKCYFGRIQPIDLALQYGFFDEFPKMN